MARIEPLVEKMFPLEGGFCNDPDDKGGPTNMGVTLATWKSQGYDKDGDNDIDIDDLKLITSEDVINLLRWYWNRWKADQIVNQSIAEFLVDWVWNSGTAGIKIPQRVLKVGADGKVGPMTINAVNNANQLELFNDLKAARREFIDDICDNDWSQRKFKQGWYNRIDSFVFKK